MPKRVIKKKIAAKKRKSTNPVPQINQVAKKPL
jgi:hypothetical protein